MKHLMVVLLLGTSIHLYSQGIYPVNRDSVRQMVNDTTSEFYYPRLLDRFTSFDLGLTTLHYRLLYYGFVFQPAYSAYPVFGEKELFAALDRKDYEKALRISDSIVQKYPVSLRATHNLVAALMAANAHGTVLDQYRERYISLMNAVVSTGDGKSCATAIKTIFVPDEYEVMENYFNIKEMINQTTNGHCDKFTIKPTASYSEKELYFDTSESFIYLQEIFRKQEN